MSAIHTSNNTLLQAGTDPIFTGIQHDETLSGLGTLESPLGCIKDDFTGVSTDNTISGDGLNSPLGVVGINSFTGVITDNNLTGNGYDSALGINSSISASTFKAGNTTVTDNSITMSDTYGDTTITPTKIRTWDSNSVPPAPVTVDNLKFASVPGDADLSNASAAISNRGSRYQFNISNVHGNHAEFTMIPTGIGSGFLYMSGANVSAKPIDLPTCSAYDIDVGEDGIDFVIPDYCNQFTFTTPTNDEYHGGSPTYRVKVDGLQMNVASGAYVTLYRMRTYNGGDTTEWRFISGNSLPIW